MSETDIIGFLAIAAPIASAVGAIVILTWWLSRQFQDVRESILKGLQEVRLTIDEKMRLHEMRNDERFEALNRRLFGIELRNAIRDGKLPPDFEERKP